MLIKRKYLAPIFILLSLLMYLPAYRYGMVTDFLGWIIKYQNGSWGDVPSSFGYKGLHPFFHLINFSFFKIFGLNKFAWSFFFAFLHGINAFLVFRLVVELLNKRDRYLGVALYCGLFFLISPYQLEVLTWKACLHYLISTMLMLKAMLLLLEYLKDNAKYSVLLLHHLLFVLALFTLEISLAAPFIFLLTAIVYTNIDQSKLSAWLLKGFAVQLIIIAGYFALNKVLLGDWVGHYGAEKHMVFDPAILVGNGLKYFWKYLMLGSFWTYGMREAVYQACENPMVVYGGLLIGLLVVGRFAYRIHRQTILSKFNMLNFLAFFMALFPIVNLFFVYILPYENDRYSYLASVFFYPFMVGFLYLIFNHWAKGLVALILLVHLFFSVKMIYYANQAGKVLDGLVEDFEWCDSDRVVLLGLPDNYHGLYLYRDLDDSLATSFKESIELFEQVKCKTQIIDAFQFNQIRTQDHVSASLLENGKIRVKFEQFGNWFWKDGIGFRSFENDAFKSIQNPYSVDLRLKTAADSLIFVRPIGTTWEQVEF